MPRIPFSLQWAISENQLLPLRDSVNEFLSCTSVSNIPSFKFYLNIWANGNNDVNRGRASVFLRLEFKTVKKVESECTFTISSTNYSEKVHYIYEKTAGYGIQICDVNDLFDPEKKFIVDGKLAIKVEGMFKFGNDIIPAAVDEQKWKGGELGDDLWKKDETKDFTIVVDGDKEIKVCFFSYNRKKQPLIAPPKMIIPDFPFAVVETGIKIIYTCNSTTSLTMEELMLLLQFFDKYNLTAQKTKVAPFLISHISASTVCRLANCSILINALKLKNKCIEFLMDYFASKIPLDDIDTLDKDILLKIVKSSFIQIVETKS